MSPGLFGMAVDLVTKMSPANFTSNEGQPPKKLHFIIVRNPKLGPKV